MEKTLKRTSRSTGNTRTTGKGNYKQAIQQAYNNGYRAGWAAHEELPNRFGARTVAKHGYSNGMRDHKRDDKYRNRVKK